MKSFYAVRIHGEERRAGYWGAHRDVIADLIERSVVLVVCLKHQKWNPVCACGCGDGAPESSVMAWACGEPKRFRLVLHYVYTKRPYRRAGFAKHLVDSLRDMSPGPKGTDPRTGEGVNLRARVVCTHITTSDIRALVASRDWGTAELAPFYAYIQRRMPK